MDPSSSWPLLVLYLFMIVGAGYFAAAETAFSSASRIRLLSSDRAEDKRTKTALSLLDDFDTTITTLLVGTNLLHAGCAAVATIFAAKVISGDGGALSSAIATAVTTVLVFLFSEMIPKTFAQDRADSLALALAGSVKVFRTVFYPLSILFLGLGKLLDRIFPKKAEPTVTEEELSSIIEAGEEEGSLDEDACELLQSALEYSGTRVADVVTLRADVHYVLLSDSKEVLLKKLLETPFSRIPVCRTSLDDCVGILVVTDFLTAVIDGTYTRLSRLVRKPFYTTIDASIDDLQDEMTGKRQHLALVRDRSGEHVIGLVTIEDFVEELVGEIYDENDVVDDDFMKLGGNYFRVSGKLLLSKMFTDMKYTPAKLPGAHKTVSSWILEELGRIPEEEDTFEVGPFSVEVETVEQNRVLYATVKLEDPSLTLPEEPAKGGDEAV